ncbi:MAG: hypothetical protein ACREB3_13915, partial [Burkholderiales bacterium]
MNKPANNSSAAAEKSAAPATNFIRNLIDADLAKGKYASRIWGGKPGPSAVHSGAQKDPAR